MVISLSWTAVYEKMTLAFNWSWDCSLESCDEVWTSFSGTRKSAGD